MMQLKIPQRLCLRFSTAVPFLAEMEARWRVSCCHEIDMASTLEMFEYGVLALLSLQRQILL